MLTINKTQPTQRIICTLSEKTMASGNVYLLKIENKQSNINYSFLLPTNTSVFKDRYDEFIFPTTSITDWKTGQAIYTIWEYNATTQTLIQELEFGLMEIIDEADPEFESIAMIDTDDDYAVFKN